MRTYPTLRVAALAAAVAGLVACGADSAKSPTQPPTGPVTPTPAVTAVVSIAVSQSQLIANSSTGATITVTAVRSDNGNPVPDGTEATISTTLGSLVSYPTGPTTVDIAMTNGRAVVSFFAGSSIGIATIRAAVTYSGVTSVATAEVRIVEAASLFVQSVSPTTGSPQGGESVTVIGGGFATPLRVTFDNVPAQVVSSSGSQIRVLTPARAAGPLDGNQTDPVDVTVVARYGQADQDTDTLPSGFIYTNGGTTTQPQIFSLTPASGPNEGGTAVTIQGDGFVAPVQVFFGNGSTSSTFNGIEATVTSVTSSRVVVQTPAAVSFGQDLQNEVVDVLVKNLNSGKWAVATSAFKYGVSVLITAIGPSEGPTSGGQLVTIFGQGFDEPVAVEMGTVGQFPISVSGTEIVVRTSAIQVSSCADVSGPTKVTNIESGDGFDSGPVYTYRVQKPLITGISPTSGATGSSITITGSGFSTSPGVRVLFGGTGGSAATIVSNTSTSIVARVPAAPAAFTFDTEPCDGNGDGVLGGTRPIPTPIDVMVMNLDGSTCSDTFTNGFVINPPSTACSGDTSEPPTPVAAAFTYTVAPNPSLAVTFQDTSTGTPTTWSWNFGDSSTSTAQNPTHTYLAAGTYTVTLTASKSGSTSTTSQFVTVPGP